MANVSLTATCNRSCAFCFAADAMEARRDATPHMPLPRVEDSLDFLARSGIRQVRLLGGEPTLHPEFERILDLCVARGLQVMVFSGGMIPERALRALERLPNDGLSLLLNVIAPNADKPRDSARQADVMQRLGPRVSLGVTIDSPGAQFDYLLALIDRHDLGRTVRLGIAHPTLHGANSYLHPRHYPEVGRRVAAFGVQAQSVGVTLEFDCGWVPCMFPEGALAALGKGPDEVGLRCGPILDLMPDGQVISCYALSSHLATALPPERDARWLRQHFAERLAPERGVMLYRACETCEWRERGECTGGCLSASLTRLRHRPFSVSLPEPLA